MNKADIQSLNKLYLLVEASKGPPYIKIENGNKFYYKDPAMNTLHREDGPAIEYVDGSKFWFLNGKLHREDGPAFEGGDGKKEWYLNGKLHREDGPAIEYPDGYKEWRLNGELHREDGPAIEYANGDKEWYLDGARHREDGPAVEYANGNKEWWLNDEEFSEKELKAFLATRQYNKTVQDRGRKGDVEGDFDF